MEQIQSNGSNVRMRMLTNFASIAALILMVFITSMIVTLKHNVADLRLELATKQDLVNLAVYVGPVDSAMQALDASCTDCHTRETFAAAHGLDEDAHDLVVRMSQISGAHFSSDEIPRVEAALTFMKCAHCHTQERLKELAILSPKERWDVILAMMNKPGAEISQQDAQRIRDFYGDFWGWHSRR